MRQIVDEVDDPRVRFDFVWVPILFGDGLGPAMAEMPLSPDPRARVWWDQLGVLTSGLSPFFNGLDPVWDVYLMYEAGATWDTEETDSPGKPDYYQHQLSQLMGHLWLNKAALKTQLLGRLPSCTYVVTP